MTLGRLYTLQVYIAIGRLLLYQQYFLCYLFHFSSFIVRKDSIWDKLVFGKVQKLLGGKVKIVITGSAPLEAKVFNFIRAAFGCVVRMAAIFGDFKWLYNEKKNPVIKVIFYTRVLWKIKGKITLSAICVLLDMLVFTYWDLVR